METFSRKKTSLFKILLGLCLIASLSLGAYINTSKDVKITIDFETKEVNSYAKTIEELLKSENIKIEEGSYLSIDKEKQLEDGMHLVISSPKTFILKEGKERTEIKSTYTRVEDILKDQDIELTKKDYTTPEVSEKAKLGSEIEVVRVTEKIENMEKEIPFESKTEKNKKLDEGKKKVVQEGEKGLKEITLKKTYENGTLVSEERIKETVLEKPVAKITEVGTKKKVKKTSRGDLNVAKTITMNATAYDDTPQSQGKWVGTTAIGVKPRVGIVAVDPRVIPLGTKLYIESLDGTKDYGYALAGDTGGAIKGNRIDLFFNTRGEVRNFGRRQVKVHVLN